jgi:hypothetical protein
MPSDPGGYGKRCEGGAKITPETAFYRVFVVFVRLSQKSPNKFGFLQHP